MARPHGREDAPANIGEPGAAFCAKRFRRVQRRGGALRMIVVRMRENPASMRFL
jgi:hypothetical protein